MRTTMLIVSAVAIAACGRGAGDERPADTLATVTTSASTAPAPFYEVVGHLAENAYDFVKMSDWAPARATVDSLKAVVAGYQAGNAVDRGADLRESLARLDSAVSRRSRAEGLRNANRLTEIGASLAAAHATALPVAVTMLDYYGRELEIGAEGVDTAQLSRAALGIRTTWTKLRPQVVARGGTTEAAEFDGVVGDVSAARTPAQYARTATPILDQVDVLEAVFLR